MTLADLIVYVLIGLTVWIVVSVPVSVLAGRRLKGRMTAPVAPTGHREVA